MGFGARGHGSWDMRKKSAGFAGFRRSLKSHAEARVSTGQRTEWEAGEEQAHANYYAAQMALFESTLRARRRVWAVTSERHGEGLLLRWGPDYAGLLLRDLIVAAGSLVFVLVGVISASPGWAIFGLLGCATVVADVLVKRAKWELFVRPGDDVIETVLARVGRHTASEESGAVRQLLAGHVDAVRSDAPSTLTHARAGRRRDA